MSKELKQIYVCEGTCKARVSDAEYKNGLRKCGDKTCSQYGTPFIKMNLDKQGHLFPFGEKHKH